MMPPDDLMDKIVGSIPGDPGMHRTASDNLNPVYAESTAVETA